MDRQFYPPRASDAEAFVLAFSITDKETLASVEKYVHLLALCVARVLLPQLLSSSSYTSFFLCDLIVLLQAMACGNRPLCQARHSEGTLPNVPSVIATFTHTHDTHTGVRRSQAGSGRQPTSDRGPGPGMRPPLSHLDMCE